MKTRFYKIWQDCMTGKYYLNHNKYTFEVTVEINATLYQSLLNRFEWHDVGFNRKLAIIVP